MEIKTKLQFLHAYLPFIVVLVIILTSIILDGVSAYDIPEPFGWLSDPSASTGGAGCF